MQHLSTKMLFDLWAFNCRYTDLPSLAASQCYNSQRVVVYLPLLIPQLEPIREKHVRSFAPSFGKSGYLINSASFSKNNWQINNVWYLYDFDPNIKNGLWISEQVYKNDHIYIYIYQAHRILYVFSFV